jgi:hypothetical protein
MYFKYMHTYTHTTCMYVSACVYSRNCRSMYVCMYVRMHAYVRTFLLVHVCVCVCVYVCVCVCVSCVCARRHTPYPHHSLLRTKTKPNLNQT